MSDPLAPGPSQDVKDPNCPVLSYFASPERSSPEEIAREAEEILRVSTVRELLDVMPDFVMILNRNRQIIFSNRNVRAYAENHGFGVINGLRPGEFFQCERMAAAPSGCGTHEGCRTCGAVVAILAGLAGESVIKECRISTLDHGAFDFRIWASPFHLGARQFVLIIAVDISHENRKKALERIFFHDLLNTAGGISGMVMLLTEGVRSVDYLKDDLRETADALVDEIRSFRILMAAETHELEVTPTPLRSREVLERAIAQSRNHTVAAGKEIRIAPESANFSFNSDEVLLKRILCNLIKNALEASAPGETVTVGAEKPEHQCVFWCHNAAAMPPDVRFQVFQRSFSTKGSGRGLGTYSVRLLTEGYLGGKASFESAEGAGTTFRVSLPAE